MFHYADGLKLTNIDFAIDFRRRQPRGFISHAHADHMAPHELAFCTPTTAKLYQHRLGTRPVHEMPFREPLEWNGWQLTTYPAGHVLGSAMLLANDGQQTLLYTGDFKLSASATSEATECPHADILVMESTFGDPKYRLPPRDKVIADLVGIVQQSLSVGVTPVIQAYVLGKAQEVSKILTNHGIPVLQHREMFAISQIYESCGCEMGNVREYDGKPIEGHALVMPPPQQKFARPALPEKVYTIAVTGWANDSRAKFRLGVDYAITITCYDPSPSGEACGACDACLLRLKGFAEAGIADPARYRG